MVGDMGGFFDVVFKREKSGEENRCRSRCCVVFVVVFRPFRAVFALFEFFIETGRQVGGVSCRCLVFDWVVVVFVNIVG